MEPRAARLHRAGQLVGRAAEAVRRLEGCTICPRRCGADRAEGERGVCGGRRLARVASWGPHFGEERPLVGSGGSGTVFFSGCNLLCCFCQNCDISHSDVGQELDAGELARLMLDLQRRGCHNINLVTPTHVVPQILEALPRAIDSGLSLPLVYNSSGYDSVEALELLDGVIDIYMPDFKFWRGEGADYLEGVADYGVRAEAAVAEMHRQVGDLRIERGIAVGGLLVRHLVMPRGAADTASIMAFLASLSTNTYVNIMAQYRPVFRARGHPVIGTRITAREYEEALQAARSAGLRRLDR